MLGYLINKIDVQVLEGRSLYYFTGYPEFTYSAGSTQPNGGEITKRT